jgi:DHA1 family tetracycline resistance protein-like MFS transporter
MMQGLVFPSLQGLMSGEVPATEQGELQGAIASVQSLSSIFGPPLMTGSFAYFSSPAAPVHMPGAPFLLGAGFAVLTLVIFSRAVAMGAGRRPVAAAAT